MLEHIPRPFPDKSREGHYLDVFSTPNTNEDGSPREIDEFLPRARVKKLFATGELHSSDKPQMTELSKELCVSLVLLEDCVKHCEELALLSDMRSRERVQKKEERDARVYEDYNWSDIIQSGTLQKLTVKELDKYMDYHQLPRKYLSKKGKVECILHHYYRATGEEHNESSIDFSDNEEDNLVPRVFLIGKTLVTE